MGSKLSRRRLIGSGLLAMAIMGFAYLSVRPDSVSRVTASNTDELLKTLASKDSDGDGLLDWEEVLYGTDPQNTNSVQDDLTDAEAVAQGLVSVTAPEAAPVDTSSIDETGVSAPSTGSLTEQFAQMLFSQFTNYLEENGPEAAEDITRASFITDLVTSFYETTEELLQSRYTLTTITIEPGVSTLDYTAQVEDTFKRPGTGIENAGEPLVLIETALAEQGGEQARADLAVLGAFYIDIARDLAQVPVPGELADTHLALVQSFDLLGLSLGAVSHVSEDPLVALAALASFESAPQGIKRGFEDIANAVARSYGTPQTPEDPGFLLRALVSSPL